ncbi:MAG: DsbC family protein, partial [Granulosicoccaceae bacterium]
MYIATTIRVPDFNASRFNAGLNYHLNGWSKANLQEEFYIMKQSLRAVGALFFGVFALLGAAHADVADEVKERLASKMPQLDIKTVTASPVAGMYEVVFDGYRVVYVSEDAQYVLDGSLMELATGRNLTRQRSDELQMARYVEMGKVWVKALRDFGADRYVNYEGDDAAELKGREMYVFTDITCPFCARFHQQIGELNAAGVTVRYILFARAGMNSEPHRQHISIWCADDRLQALTDGKEGRPV